MTVAFVVAACVLVVRDGRVLALRRSPTKDVGAGLWEALSGRVEVDEEPLETARREALEESGLDVEVERRPWTVYRTLRGDRPMIVIVYRARFRTGRLALSDEHDAHAWVDADGFAALSPLPQLVAAVRSALGAPARSVTRRTELRGKGGAGNQAAHTEPGAQSRHPRIDRATLVARLRALGLPAGDWVVHGSGSMLAHELIDDAGDIDVVARGAAWEAAAARGVVTEELWDRKVVLPGGVEVFDGWGPFDAAALIDAAVDIDGVPCARLRDVLAFKRWIGRPKDRRHLELLARVVADSGDA